MKNPLHARISSHQQIPSPLMSRDPYASTSGIVPAGGAGPSSLTSGYIQEYQQPYSTRRLTRERTEEGTAGRAGDASTTSPFPGRPTAQQKFGKKLLLRESKNSIQARTRMAFGRLPGTRSAAKQPGIGGERSLSPGLSGTRFLPKFKQHAKRCMPALPMPEAWPYRMNRVRRTA